MNDPEDRYEQEADHVAGEIMQMPASESSVASPQMHRIPRQGEHAQAGQTLRSPEPAAASQSELSPATVALVNSLDARGEPLMPALRYFFEPRFGHSFEDVRVHTDKAAATSARDLDALAYTRGRHIVFAEGQFEPYSERGRRLLAHELTHVVQQGWARQEERIQRSYVAPVAEETVRRELPHPVVVAPPEDERPQIQRAPAPKTPDTPGTTPDVALASPSLTFSPGDAIMRGDTLTASVAFTPTAGEKLTVTGWQYTTDKGEVVTRPNVDRKFQTEWQGVMALSGKMELSYTVAPKRGTAVAGPPVISHVTVNDRTGSDWQTSITDSSEMPLTGKPSPPELAEELGLHVVPSDLEPAADQKPVRGGPNAGFIFVSLVQDRKYKSDPLIHPDVSNDSSPFRVFHRNAGRVVFVTRAGARNVIPPAEYTNPRTVGGTLKFDVPDWTAFYKKHGVWTITCTAAGRTITARDDWWALKTNAELGEVTITNPGAVRAALRIGNDVGFSVSQNPNGIWEGAPLMPSAKILGATRSHEYLHPQHSHRANFHAIVRALDPRRELERTVSTPSSPVTFRDKIHELSTEIQKPNHELVDEAASKTAGRFVAVRGKTMAAVNQDPASGASLGALWDLTHDRPLG